ncbi:MAG: hypothetical protein EYC62_03920 [Alphaproteobacteria bacterium]|nr:MAG: hypothetical protein EYC62_03920 [Alphaproteobacteria bacterium]
MTTTAPAVIELTSPDDLFRHLVELGLDLSAVIKGYSDSPYAVSWIDAKEANQTAAEKLSQLWNAANKKGWRDIFTANIISRERLTPKGAEESLAFGNRGLWLPISRLASKMVRHYPGLVWDANDPAIQNFCQRCVFGGLDTYDNNEVVLEVILDRLEKARDPNFPAERRDAHMAASHQMARFLLQSNLRYRTVELSAQDRALLESAVTQAKDSAAIALLCARLDYRYAAVKWVDKSGIEAGQKRATAAEGRALKLRPSQADDSNPVLLVALRQARGYGPR